MPQIQFSPPPPTAAPAPKSTAGAVTQPAPGSSPIKDPDGDNDGGAKSSAAPKSFGAPNMSTGVHAALSKLDLGG